MTNLLAALKQLQEHGPKDKTNGICRNLNRLYTREEHCAMYDSYGSWPHFSGSVAFPVPAPVGQPLDRIDYYYSGQADLWDKSTEYGRMRWDLLDHMIKELSK